MVYNIWKLKYGVKEADKRYKEWKERESKSQSGENNSFYGRTHTEETKERIRQKQTGKRFTDEINKKKGRKRYAAENGMFGRIWITNNTENKIITKDKLNNYLENGWSKGRKIQRA